MVRVLSLVAIAALLSFWAVLVVSVCACASCVMAMVYLPAIALPLVVALNAVLELVVVVAEFVGLVLMVF